MSTVSGSSGAAVIKAEDQEEFVSSAVLEALEDDPTGVEEALGMDIEEALQTPSFLAGLSVVEDAVYSVLPEEAATAAIAAAVAVLSRRKWFVTDEAQASETIQEIFKELKVSQVKRTVDRDFLEGRIKEEGLEESFYVVDLGTVIHKLGNWHRELPNVHPFYAVKCNPDEGILRTLNTLGVNFDCASREEIAMVMSLGVDASRIIYANPCKMRSHLRFSKAAGVHLMTVDSESEIRKTALEDPKAEMVLRLATDDSHSLCAFSSKFGTRGIDEQIRLLRIIKEVGLQMVGVSFHVGSGCQDPMSYEKAIHDSRLVFDEAEALGFEPYLVDIGGGFPGNDVGSVVTFPEMAAVIRDSLQKYFPDPEGTRYSFIAEPGRYFATASHTLACNIFTKKHKTAAEGGPHNTYYIDDGVYQSFNCIYFDHVTIKPRPLKLLPPDFPKVPSTIFGPTCDSIDKISDSVMLEDLDVDDWLYFEDMGAYTRAASSAFNGFGARKIVYVCSYAGYNSVEPLAPMSTE